MSSVLRVLHRLAIVIGLACLLIACSAIAQISVSPGLIDPAVIGALDNGVDLSLDASPSLTNMLDALNAADMKIEQGYQLLDASPVELTPEATGDSVLTN